ncbi:MAG: hypothetical protein LC642_05150 [Verrucomicrobiaceae bacterium]|nr:hypothetical protein [Verrucomicrobiaceae bacterium]
MIKINGTPQVETPEGALGYARISLALLNSACDNFFLRRGMPRGTDGRSFRSQAHAEALANFKRAGSRSPKVVRIRRADLSFIVSKRLERNPLK